MNSQSNARTAARQKQATDWTGLLDGSLIAGIVIRFKIRSTLLLQLYIPFSRILGQRAFFLGPLTIAAMAADGILAFFFDIARPQLDSTWGILVFGLVSLVIYGLGGNYLLSFANDTTTKSGMLAHSTLSAFNRLFRLVMLVQLVLSVLLLALILQMAMESKYDMALSNAIIGLGTLPGAVYYAFLGYKLFSWFFAVRRNITILLLGLAATTGSLAMLGNLVILSIVSEGSQVVSNASYVNFNHISPSSSVNALFYLLVVTVAEISAMFQWAAITLILRHFSKQLGKARLWTLICLPAIVFLVGTVPSLATSPTGDYKLFSTPYLSFRVIAIIGSIGMQMIWGIGYWSIARNMKNVGQQHIGKYMLMSAYGIMATSIAYLSPVIFKTFPPFGLPAHSFLTLAAYLFSIGFYYSAAYISENAAVRTAIRKQVLAESKLLDSIGTADVMKRLEKTVMMVAKANSEEVESRTGIIQTMSQQDIMHYVNQVMGEIQSQKQRQNQKQKQDRFPK
jgi:hypothetical protein